LSRSFLSRFTLWGIFVLFLALPAGLLWFNLTYLPRFTTGGHFPGYWTWSRTFLKDGHSPYTQTSLNRIQRLHTQLGENEADPSAALTHPLHAVLLLAPFALVDDYPLAQALWTTALQAALLFLTFYSLHLTGWRVRPWLAVLLALFGLSWFYGVYALLSGDLAVLIAVLLAMFYGALKAGLDELGGFLLALATAAPFLVALLVLFSLLWALFQRRWRFLTWFLGSLVLFVFAGVLFLPAWPLHYFEFMRAYLIEGSWLSAHTAFALLSPGLGARLALLFSALLAVLLLWEWWRACSSREVSRFLWVAFLTLAVSFLLGLPASPTGPVLLLMPLVFVFSVFEVRWARTGQTLVLASLFLLFSLPWFLYWRMTHNAAPPESLTYLLFPLPLYLIVALYWVRYWAVRPARLFDQSMRLQEHRR
jgi:hypothetical protein